MAAAEGRQPVRRKVAYRGRVQGVGFRMTVASIARGYPVTGYVKNLRGGNVELVVAGDSDEVDAFLAEVAGTFPRNITDVEVGEPDTVERFESFEIRY